MADQDTSNRQELLRLLFIVTFNTRATISSFIPPLDFSVVVHMEEEWNWSRHAFFFSLVQFELDTVLFQPRHLCHENSFCWQSFDSLRQKIHEYRWCNISNVTEKRSFLGTCNTVLKQKHQVVFRPNESNRTMTCVCTPKNLSRKRL